ncbi:hypothetical protein Tco_0091001 [Tanacetum coccineum]
MVGHLFLPPTTADEHIAVHGRNHRRELPCLQSIPDDHWLIYIICFRISEAEVLTKDMTYVKNMSQLNQLKSQTLDENINLKFLRALPSSWSQVALTLKTKGGLELLSFDDLYYKLKTLEVDIKGYSTFFFNQSAVPSHSVFVFVPTSASKKESYVDHPTNLHLPTLFQSNSKTRFAKTDSMKAVSPPLSRDYTPLSDHTDLDESQMSYGTKSSTSGDSNSVSNDFVSCDNSDKSSEVNSNDFASSDSSVKSSEPKNHVNHQNQFVPQAVLLRTGKVNIPSASPQPVPTGKPKVPEPVPTDWQLLLSSSADDLGRHIEKKNSYTDVEKQGILIVVVLAFDGKADEGYIVGYSASNKAYRVYNVPTKRVEEMMNLRYLEEKPNVQGLGHEWYFDLDYLTDSLCYKCDKANQSAGTHEASTNPAGTQDADSDSECDEQVIIIPSYPSHSIQEAEPKDISGDEVDDSPLDSAEEIFQKELARLKVPTSIQLTHSFDEEPTTNFLFGADLNNLASTVEVSHVATKRIKTIHPQSLIIRDPTSVVQTRSKEEMQQFKFQNVWVFVDLPEDKYAIGDLNGYSKIREMPGGLFQNKYVKEILQKFDLENVKTATTPYEAQKPKSKNEPDSPVNVHLYRSMIGSLMYLTASRPDIMFAVSACSRNQVTPTTSNLEAVKKIFNTVDYAGRKTGYGNLQLVDVSIFRVRRLIYGNARRQTNMATSYPV